MKKKLPALVLSLSLCLSLLPAAFAAEGEPRTYDQAVAELRGGFTYVSQSEQTYETDDCTVFFYDRGGAMHTGSGYITVIYKPGSAKGDGFTFEPPTPGNDFSPLIPRTPDHVELSGDKKSFTYSYHFDEPLISGGQMIRAAGDFVYTVDLPSGEVTETLPQVPAAANSYSASLARVLEENAKNGRVSEKTVEAPLCTLLFSRFSAGDGKRSYFLEAIYKTGVDADVGGSVRHTDEGDVKDIPLPVTGDDGTGLSGGGPVLYCGRMPDSMTLSDDGSTFTFVYNECLYGSPYTSVVDLRSGLVDHPTSGESGTADNGVGKDEGAAGDVPAQEPRPVQPSVFSDVPAGSWFEQGVAICAEKGVMVGTGEGIFSPDDTLSAAQCLTLATRLYDLQRGGDGTLETAPGDWGLVTLTLSDGTPFYTYCEQNPFFTFGLYFLDAPDLKAAYVLTPGDTAEERLAWAKAHEGRAELTADGVCYAGSVQALTSHDGPCLAFLADNDEDAQRICDLLSSTIRPGTDKWYRNTVYTVEQWELSELQGFQELRNNLFYSYGGTMSAERRSFAFALASAVGTLEKKYDVPELPDIERNAYYEPIYQLYEAGVLSGMDRCGTFYPSKSLSRAEAAVMAARVLDEAQRLTQPPALPDPYEQALISRRTSFGYYEQDLLESPYCTILVYGIGGVMHGSSGITCLIYKDGSGKEPGTVIHLPYVADNGWGGSITPSTMVLSEDGGTLTYTYLFYYEVLAIDGVSPLHEVGTYTFTVDLASGEVEEDFAPLTYAQALAYIRGEEPEMLYTVERQLDAPLAAAVLRYGADDSGQRDYSLYLVSNAGGDLPEGTMTKLLLPSTAVGEYSYHPTTQAPDSLTLSEDGKTLTYVYRFSEELRDQNGSQLHDKGTYTYTVDLSTGELRVAHTPEVPQR